MPEASDRLADTPSPTRYRLRVRYDGRNFRGWQKQEPPDREPLRTVQAVLEDAVRRAVREPITLVGASRTDSGVHAEGQIAAFTTSRPTTIPLERLHLAINRRLPDDVAVTEARVVSLEFDPISDAVAKGYRYEIHADRVRPVFERHRVHHCWHGLDVARMDEAARRIVGEHDFASFANVRHGRESTVRTVFTCTVARDAHRRERIRIDTSGSGYLYHMVRIMAGTLVEAGRGRIEPDDLPEILAARQRGAAGPTLGPEGLCLRWIRYPDDAETQA